MRARATVASVVLLLSAKTRALSLSRQTWPSRRLNTRWSRKTLPSPCVIHHHPVFSDQPAPPENNNNNNSKTINSDNNNKKFLSKLSPQRRNALIRVTIAASVMFVIANRYSQNTIALNGAVSLALAMFLASVERSRAWVAAWRCRATELWQSAQAHYVLAIDAREETLQERQNAQAAERITLVGTAVNIGLTIFKLVAGIVGKSSAMVADAGHSLSDLASDLVTFYTIRIARLPPDQDHPYGHGRFEALGALTIALMLGFAAISFGTYAYETFVLMVTGKYGILNKGPTGKIALYAAAVSIASKEALYRATALVAQQTESQVLLANAWHHRSDAFSSIVALFSIWGATMGGIPALDPLGGLFVAGMVGITGLRVGWSAFKQLTDTMDFELKAAVEKAVNNAISEYQLQDDVLGLHAVRARYLGSRAWVDLEVETNPMRSASAATQVVKVLKNAILSKIPSVTDVVVVLKTQQDNVEVTDNNNNKSDGGSSLDALDSSVALTPLQAEANVREALHNSEAFVTKRLKDVSSVLVHFSSPQDGQCDVDIIVSADEDAQLTISEARALAEIAKQDVIQNAQGVVDAKVSLELVAKEEAVQHDFAAEKPAL